MDFPDIQSMKRTVLNFFSSVDAYSITQMFQVRHRETRRGEDSNAVQSRVTQEGFDRLEWAQDTRPTGTGRWFDYDCFMFKTRQNITRFSW